jgi:hypothetical protein
MNKAKLILCIYLLLTACSFSKKTGSKQALNFADSLWIDYRTALSQKNINYPIKHSLDSIGCIDCIRDSLKNEKQIYDSKLIFTSYLTEFKHLTDLEKHPFSSYQTDSIIYISYSINCKEAEESAYGLHYRFRKVKHLYLLEDMFTVP